MKGRDKRRRVKLRRADELGKMRKETANREGAKSAKETKGITLSPACGK